MHSKKNVIIVNAILYQLIWFLCILYDNRGALLGLVLIGIHFVFSSRKREDFTLLILFLATGLIIDGTLHFTGFFTFTKTGWPIPFWLAVIWMGFSLTVNHSLQWLQERPILCSILGGIGGPLAYWAGVRLGAAGFTLPLPAALLLLSLIWAIIVPLLFIKLNHLFVRHLIPHQPK